MADLAVLLQNLDSKVDGLLGANEDLKQENLRLNQHADELKAALSSSQTAIVALEDEIKMLKMANSVAGVSEKNTEMKLKINELVKEIDKCMALLTD